MTDAVYQLIYCSRTTTTSPDETARIFTASRANNQRDELTGALLHNDGVFAQVLEGPLAAIERTFERIQCDHRHDDVAVLQFGPAERRAFPNWLMADAGATLGPDAAPLLAGLLAVPATQAASEVLSVLHGLVNREVN